MSINARNLLGRIKDELRITTSVDDPRLVTLIGEAVYSLQQFKCMTLVDTIADPATETKLNPLDIRYLIIYVALQYDGDAALDTALGSVLEQVRDK